MTLAHPRRSYARWLLLGGLGLATLTSPACTRGRTPAPVRDAAPTDPAAAQGPPTAADANAPTDAGEPDGAGAASPDVAVGGYDPCPPAGTACRIMPLGDSITWGAGSTTMGGYRAVIFSRALAGKQTIAFVGDQTSGPATVDAQPFPQHSEGYSGYTIDTGGDRRGIYPLVEAALTTHKPHIVLLHIGTNDVDIALDLAGAPARLGRLLDRITTAAPDALVVVAQIVPAQDDAVDRRIRAYNAAIPAVVAERAAAGKHVVVVDMYKAFTAVRGYKTALLNDGLHPNDRGHAKMADVWLQAIGRYLK